MIPDSQSAPRARWAVATMFLANGFIMGSWAPQIPLLLPRHGITEFTLGLLILALGIGAVTAMAFSGALIARHGSLRVLRVFAVTASVTLALVVLAPTLALLTLAMMLMGALIGCMDVAMNANAVEVERRLGRAIMSSSHGFWSLGGFLGGGVGGLLIGALGAQVQAVLVCAIALGLVLAAMPFLRGEPAAPQPVAGEARRSFFPRNAGIWIIGGMALLSMVPEGAVLDWAALYVTQELGADVAASGLAFAFFSGTMAIMRFAGDSVRNRFGAVMTLRVSALIGAAGLLGAAVAPTETLAIAAFALSGIGIANMVPITLSAAGNYPGLGPGVGISTVTMLGYSGILVAPSSIGFVAEAIGFRVTYGVLAVLLVLVAGLAARCAAADARQAH
ncbi:MFS transporter [Fertoebacter nigrum]|uniref:MFS transporter n=1 Tax=Fertoeibacter niger TaxID=2656921 RepID=A0A8X8GWK1_9RHOB|nr:MFS transporter [Fertoeibacter niger]NUB44457.1 MFS transporter [Fertoeibacter niger]